MMKGHIQNKRHMWSSTRKQEQAFEHPHPVESHGTCFIPQRWVTMIHEKRCLLESSLETQCHKFLLGCDGADTPYVPHMPKSQTPRQKADIQHNPHCLYAQHRHADPLFSVQVIETPKIQVSRWQSRVHLRRPFKVEWVDLSWEPFSAYHINAEGPGVQQNGRRRVGWEEEWWRLREERMTGDKPLSTIQGIILPQTCYSQFIDERTGAGRS